MQPLRLGGSRGDEGRSEPSEDLLRGDAEHHRRREVAAGVECAQRLLEVGQGLRGEAGRPLAEAVH